jgi:iron complex outermembrane receptor protein
MCLCAACPGPGLAGGDESAAPAHLEEAEAVVFEEMPEIETAALRTQTLQEAPAMVTVITQQDIRRFGYRSLSEIMAKVRGFYVSRDGVETYVGVRGFSLPGDYNSRILVMVNGHAMTDNVFGAMYMFDEDFPLDMELVERIEIVRGPSSALYGSNGVFATVNIFTRLPLESDRSSVSIEGANEEGGKLAVSSSFSLTPEANLLVSASGFRFGGREVVLPGLEKDTPLGGWTDNVGNQTGQHAFTQMTWRNWSLTALFGERRMMAPSGWFSTNLGDTGTYTKDKRGYVELAWDGSVGTLGTLAWRLYYDSFRYNGNYIYSGEDNSPLVKEDLALGDWIGSRLALHSSASKLGKLAMGLEVSAEVRNKQLYWADSGGSRLTFVDASVRNRSLGAFAQQEIELTPHWTLLMAGRVDLSRYYAASLSPRLALVYKPSGTTSIKLMYGKAFRNPSAFERFYVPNPALSPERFGTLEMGLEKNLGRSLDVTLSAYRSKSRGLIEGVPATADMLLYRNLPDASSKGVETGLRWRLCESLEANAGASVQRAEYEKGFGRHMPNSPRWLAHARLAIPLLRRRITLAPSVEYVSARRSVAGEELPGGALWDMTAVLQRVSQKLDLTLRLRNVTAREYCDPLSPEHLTDLLPAPGRSFSVKVTWRTAD